MRILKYSAQDGCKCSYTVAKVCRQSTELNKQMTTGTNQHFGSLDFYNDNRGNSGTGQQLGN
jgi:hypothetical protein